MFNRVARVKMRQPDSSGDDVSPLSQRERERDCWGLRLQRQPRVRLKLLQNSDMYIRTNENENNKAKLHQPVYNILEKPFLHVDFSRAKQGINKVSLSFFLCVSSCFRLEFTVKFAVQLRYFNRLTDGNFPGRVPFMIDVQDLIPRILHFFFFLKINYIFCHAPTLKTHHQTLSLV